MQFMMFCDISPIIKYTIDWHTTERTSKKKPIQKYRFSSKKNDCPLPQLKRTWKIKIHCCSQATINHFDCAILSLSKKNQWKCVYRHLPIHMYVCWIESVDVNPVQILKYLTMCQSDALNIRLTYAIEHLFWVYSKHFSQNRDHNSHPISSVVLVLFSILRNTVRRNLFRKVQFLCRSSKSFSSTIRKYGKFSFVKLSWTSTWDDSSGKMHVIKYSCLKVLTQFCEKSMWKGRLPFRCRFYCVWLTLFEYIRMAFVLRCLKFVKKYVWDLTWRVIRSNS